MRVPSVDVLIALVTSAFVIAVTNLNGKVSLESANDIPNILMKFLLPFSLWRIEDTTEMVFRRKKDGLVDENRVNNKENKNNRAVFMLYLFAYNIKPMPK